MITLKKNERLVLAGNTALRAPDGTPLPSVPTYIIASINKADPAAVATVQKNERIILAGSVLYERERAEERFAALKAGRAMPPKEDSVPLYILTEAANVDPTTGELHETAKALAAAGKDLAALISIQKRREKAL
jgi:hypothetical protein